MKDGSAVIVIETSQRIATAAIVSGDGNIFAEAAADDAPASETLADLAALLLTRAGSSRIGEVVVSDGPGSATGIRVGIAFGTGLAAGLKVPLRRVSLFESMVGGREWRPAALLAAGGTVVWGRSKESAITCGIDEFQGLLAAERFLVSADLAARFGNAIDGRVLIDMNGALTIAGRIGGR